ncbi:MAG TPA: hypothetical protein VNL39_06035 [Xanthobacteraceae bacterium]|nr:hypothetical protein [Xanthobacteraceae bacterium]
MFSKFARRRVRALAGCTVAVLLAASAGSAQEKSEPFAKFGGNWSGSGLIYLSNGTKERIRCRGNFKPENATLALDLRCAGDAYNFELQSVLSYASGVISGTWTEYSRRLNGQVSGELRGDYINAVAESQTFTARLELISQGDKQQVRITSPGGEITDVLIGLVRTSRLPPNPS